MKDKLTLSNLLARIWKAFELPRASKLLHKDAPPLPQFRDDTPPQLAFANGNENVFKARLTSKGACVQPLEEDMVSETQPLSTVQI